MYIVDEWLYRTRRTLLRAKDNQETLNRKKEKQGKTDTLGDPESPS